MWDSPTIWAIWGWLEFHPLKWWFEWWFDLGFSILGHIQGGFLLAKSCWMLLRKSLRNSDLGWPMGLSPHVPSCSLVIFKSCHPKFCQLNIPICSETPHCGSPPFSLHCLCMVSTCINGIKLILYAHIIQRHFLSLSDFRIHSPSWFPLIPFCFAQLFEPPWGPCDVESGAGCRGILVVWMPSGVAIETPSFVDDFPIF